MSDEKLSAVVSECYFAGVAVGFFCGVMVTLMAAAWYAASRVAKGLTK